MTTVDLGDPWTWTVDIGPPKAGACPVCGDHVFLYFGEWQDSQGAEGGFVPSEGWHLHKQPEYARPIQGLVERRKHLCRVIKR